jgi:hypothetical protein
VEQARLGDRIEGIPVAVDGRTDELDVVRIEAAVAIGVGGRVEFVGECIAPRGEAGSGRRPEPGAGTA